MVYNKVTMIRVFVNQAVVIPLISYSWIVMNLFLTKNKLKKLELLDLRQPYYTYPVSKQIVAKRLSSKY